MKFSFIKYTWYWFAFSILTLVIGMGAMVNNYVKDGVLMNLGIDFTGGTLMEYKFDDAKTDVTTDLFKSIDAAQPGTVSQITRTDQGTYIVLAKHMTEEEVTAIKAKVTEKLGKSELIRFTAIGPKIGETLKQKAFTALVIASIAIVLYISFAFRKVPKRVSPWRFGICALIALAHDVLTTVGFFALLGYEVDALFITALLTVMGFSVHDTIVVFDRIRENLKKQGRDDTFADVADASLHQTIGRSLNTSLSVLFPLLALYLFGAESLKPFILALLFGIFIGTYSSIFIASPLLTMWQEKLRTR